MTQQYQEESINGQPAPLSLTVNPLVAPAAGGVNTDAIFWPTLAADAVIVGNGLAVAGNAALGSIIEIDQPGVFSVEFTTADLGFVVPTSINILRGVPAGTIIGAPTYPSLDFVGVPSPGVEAVGFTQAAAPENVTISTTFRITEADLVDPAGGVNPNRQIYFSGVAAQIPTFAPPGTLISVQRVSR